MSSFTKRVLFVIGGLWLLFHGFGVAILIMTKGDSGGATPLVSALFFDAVIGAFFVLAWTASKIWPDD